MGKYHLYITCSQTSLKLDQKSLDKKLIGRKDIGQKDGRKVGTRWRRDLFEQGVRRHSSMHKWGLAPSPNRECGASEQTADYVLTVCPIHRVPHGARGLTVLDDETRCWLNDITASI